MHHSFRLTIIAASMAASCGSALALVSTTELASVLNSSSFAMGVNNQSLWTTTSGTVYGLSFSGVNGGNPLYALGGNKTAVLAALAAVADVTPKSGSATPIITLNSNVEIGVWTKSSTLLSQTTNYGTQIADFTFGSGLTFDPDPVISFPISVNNRSASAATYSFTNALILSPTLTPSNSPGTLVKSSFTGSLRSNGDGVVSIAPSIGPTIVKTTVLDGTGTVSLGVDVGNAQTFAAGSINSVNTYAAQYNPGPGAGPFAVGPAPVTGMTLMTQTVNFTLSAGDRATMLAYSEISPVPEPASALLMLAGLGAVAAAVRRRSFRVDPAQRA